MTQPTRSLNDEEVRIASTLAVIMLSKTRRTLAKFCLTNSTDGEILFKLAQEIMAVENAISGLASKPEGDGNELSGLVQKIASELDEIIAQSRGVVQ